MQELDLIDKQSTRNKFYLNGEGARFGDFSGKVWVKNGHCLDTKVYSAPVIRERIGGGSGQISGSFTVAEAMILLLLFALVHC